MAIENLTAKKLKGIRNLRDIDGYAMLADSNLTDALSDLDRIIALVLSADEYTEFLEYDEIKDLGICRDFAGHAINQLYPCIEIVRELRKEIDSKEIWEKLLNAYSRLYKERKQYRKELEANGLSE